MSTTPADPPPPAPDAGRWTTTRRQPLECSACGIAFVLSYKYRFVEGLAAAVVRCPAAGCRRGMEYYLPVNAFEVTVTASRAGLSHPA